MRKQTVIGLAACAVLTTGLLQGCMGNWSSDRPILARAGEDRIQVSAYRGDDPYTAVVIVENLGTEPIEVDSVSGLVLVTDSVYSPDLVVMAPVRGVVIDDADPRSQVHRGRVWGPVAPGARAMVEVSVLSLEHRRKGHVPGEPLTVSYVDDLLANLIQTMQRVAPGDRELAQIALWAVTDDLDANDIDEVRGITSRELFDMWFWYETAGMDPNRVRLLQGLGPMRGNGGPAMMGDVEVWVREMRRIMDLAGLRPKRQRQFLLVDVCMINRGEPVEIIEADFTLRDRTGTEYDPSHLSGKLPHGFRTRVVVDRGERYCGTLVFDIPLGASSFTLRHGDGERYFEFRGDQ